jgi:hypothetical protein
MASAPTYTPIATYTIPSTTGNYTFNSIPQTYTDLILISSAIASSGIPDVTMQFNGNSTGNYYSNTFLSGTGSSALSAKGTNQNLLYIDSYGGLNTSNFNIAEVHIMNYSNSTTYKTTLTRASNGALGVDAIVGLWRSTAAITSITLALSSSNFAAGTIFTLYGITAA